MDASLLVVKYLVFYCNIMLYTKYNIIIIHNIRCLTRVITATQLQNKLIPAKLTFCTFVKVAFAPNLNCGVVQSSMYISLRSVKLSKSLFILGIPSSLELRKEMLSTPFMPGKSRCCN